MDKTLNRMRILHHKIPDGCSSADLWGTWPNLDNLWKKAESKKGKVFRRVYWFCLYVRHFILKWFVVVKPVNDV